MIPQWIALCATCFVFGVCVRRRYFSSVSDIPGPFLASFSKLWQLYHVWDGHTEAATLKAHEKYGKFVRISHREVSVSDPEAIKALLVAPLRKATWYQIFNLPDRRYVNQMGELDPKRHIQKQRNVASGYAFSNVIQAEPYIDALVGKLEAQFDAYTKAGKEINFDHWFNFFGFDVVGEVTFSRAFGFIEQGKDIGGAVANTQFLALYIAVIGHYYWLHDILLANPLINYFNLAPSNHIFDTALAAVDARKRNPDARKDMIEQWLQTRRTHPDRMEEKELLAGAVVNVGAGADTISTTLQSFFYHLLRNPEAMAKVRAEIDASARMGELSDVPSYAETQKLPYFQACIKETYRHFPPVAFGLPRVAPKEGVTIAGRHFAEGTILSVNSHVIHKNKEIFGQDADKFNPDRWLDQERWRAMDKYFMTFGAGYNQCPGRHLAHLEVSKVTATLLRDFDIEQVNPGQSWTFKAKFTAVPYGWPCRVKRRS
ncbi:cytochrome P450 [Eremomyces bilateralis CBS 781.70]|uniref:Cytochrome P450 n=1 Tax=Eremomyces bilateralis CBS 781.70 TaxID=1392243 RepID=A0A6G1G4C5_9PEZI|nr:cytochrome P450 [Eremomyces bilateralis CBS 781.70]KAF1812842.1 cytochrome P450 [Eremomyces bilateralis CBS 781.70]